MKRIAFAALLLVMSQPVSLITAQNVNVNKNTNVNVNVNDPWNYNNNYNGSNYTWNSSWNSRPNPRSGVCLYKRTDYQGDHFCARTGDRLPYLPSNFGSNVSSIQHFGGARITVFNDRNYTGGNATFNNSTRDLRNRPFVNGHTWNNRISSIIVR